MNRTHPARAQFLSELSPAMALGLIRCQTLVILVSGTNAVRAATIAALCRHGLIEETRDARMRLIYRPTARGSQILAREEPRLLAQRSQHAYTTRPADALRNEPEAVGDWWLRKFAREADDARASEQHAVWVRERQEIERAMARLEDVENQKVQSHLRVMRMRLKAIDQELRAA